MEIILEPVMVVMKKVTGMIIDIGLGIANAIIKEK